MPSVEEAIKEIENYLDYEGSVSIQAIATLYTSYNKEKKAYKELKEIEESHRKENGKLRERVKELEEWNEYYRKEMLSKEYIKLNYIPKSKVEETIGELLEKRK